MKASGWLQSAVTITHVPSMRRSVPWHGASSVIFVLIYFLVLVFQLFFSFSFVLGFIFRFSFNFH